MEPPPRLRPARVRRLGSRAGSHGGLPEEDPSRLGTEADPRRPHTRSTSPALSGSGAKPTSRHRPQSVGAAGSHLQGLVGDRGGSRDHRCGARPAARRGCRPEPPYARLSRRHDVCALPTVTPTPTRSTSITYTVVSGDTLIGIAAGGPGEDL